MSHFFCALGRTMVVLLGFQCSAQYRSSGFATVATHKPTRLLKKVVANPPLARCLHRRSQPPQKILFSGRAQRSRRSRQLGTVNARGSQPTLRVLLLFLTSNGTLPLPTPRIPRPSLFRKSTMNIRCGFSCMLQVQPSWGGHPKRIWNTMPTARILLGSYLILPELKPRLPPIKAPSVLGR